MDTLMTAVKIVHHDLNLVFMLCCLIFFIVGVGFAMVLERLPKKRMQSPHQRRREWTSQLESNALNAARNLM